MSWRYGLRSDRYSSAIGDRYSSLYRQLRSYNYKTLLDDRRSAHFYRSLGDRYSPEYRQSPSRLDAASEATTGRQLQRVLHYSVTPCRAVSSLRAKCAMHDVDCDEVYPGIFIGDAASAKNKNFLRALGITHVLNAAEGMRWGQVDTGHTYYRDMPSIRYMGFPLIDAPSTDISRYFYVAAKFIDSAISSGGRVLVHCLVGVSRSATCVLAYLMIYRKMSAVDAVRTVGMRRGINPNEGFLHQLAELDTALKRNLFYHF